MQAVLVCFLMSSVVGCCCLGDPSKPSAWPDFLQDQRDLNNILRNKKEYACSGCIRRRQPFLQRTHNIYSASSSSSLITGQIENIADIVKGIALSDDETKRAILTTDTYNGQKTLVYKLAPGTIFRGVRQEKSYKPDNEVKISSQIQGDETNLIDVDTNLTHQKESTQSSGDGIAVKPKKNKQHLHKNLSKLFQKPSVKWKVHYVHPPPPLSSMDNPYLPSKAKEEEEVEPKPELIKISSVKTPIFPDPPPGSNILMYPIAKAIQIARTKIRGARISFMLMHYLGFIPKLPGLPRHKDPHDVMTSIMHMAGKGV